MWSGGIIAVGMVERESVPRDGVELLERSGELETLGRELEAARDLGAGRVVLVSGEAGVGKTSLLRAFRAWCGAEAEFFWGACDPLFTPRPLGPLCEIAEQAGGRLAAAVDEESKPFDIAEALLDELRRRPTVVVLEDLHWADEASLDVVRIVSRKVDRVGALVVASYRDDDLDAGHPFRRVLGELARERSVGRMRVERLSEASVGLLATRHDVDASELYRLTGGNPFFVTETLAGPAAGIPETVRDAVLARVSRLPGPAQGLLEAVAVGSRPTELWLLEALAPDELPALEACLGAGMLTADRESVAFRHELARVAVEESVAPDRWRALQRAALAALSAPPGGARDLARLAHHADAAGDAEAVIRFAPAAAERAAAVGAHREAAAQHDRALRYADGLVPEARAQLLSRAAAQYILVGRATEAIEFRRRAIEIYDQDGQGERAGRSLRALLWPLWLLGRRREAETAIREAIALLEQREPGRDLAGAYGSLAFLAMMDNDREATMSWGTRALDLAQKVGDAHGVLYPQLMMGALAFARGEAEGGATLERLLEEARAEGFIDEMATAYCWLVRGTMRWRRFGEAARYLDVGIEHCERYDLEAWGPWLVAVRAELELEQGDWQRAADTASVIVDRRGYGSASVLALVVLGRLRARRGDPGAWDVLDRALELAQGSLELDRLGPVAAARAETAWLEGRDREAVQETEEVWHLARQQGEPWFTGELAQWRRRAGVEDEPPVGVAEPYALALAGDWRASARLWRELGCPYETALVEAEGDDEHSRRALQTLHGLGARATAAVVARRLSQRGTRGLPRGPRAETSSNPAQLTARELEVLALLAEGLRNAQIAERLVVSVRTVDHHVSAILGKLGVSSRGQAAAAAGRRGLLPQA